MSSELRCKAPDRAGAIGRTNLPCRVSDGTLLQHLLSRWSDWKKEEIDKQSTFPLRMLYLQHLRNFLGNVQDDAADLEDYEEARESIEKQLEQLESEYGQWITDAIAAQED